MNSPPAPGPGGQSQAGNPGAGSQGPDLGSGGAGGRQSGPQGNTGPQDQADLIPGGSASGPSGSPNPQAGRPSGDDSPQLSDTTRRKMENAGMDSSGEGVSKEEFNRLVEQNQRIIDLLNDLVDNMNSSSPRR